MLIVDYLNHRIRKVTVSTGIITTFAGTGSASYSGDNGPATSAGLSYPEGVALDASGTIRLLTYVNLVKFLLLFFLGDVYIADANNHRIRKVTVSTGIIITVAGTGSASYSGDNGPATSASFSAPFSVAFDLAGNIYKYLYLFVFYLLFLLTR